MMPEPLFTRAARLGHFDSDPDKSLTNYTRIIFWAPPAGWKSDGQKWRMKYCRSKAIGMFLCKCMTVVTFLWWHVYGDVRTSP